MQEHMKKKKVEIVKYMEEKGITIQEYKVFLPKYKKLDLELLLSVTSLKYSSAIIEWALKTLLVITVMVVKILWIKYLQLVAPANLCAKV